MAAWVEVWPLAADENGIWLVSGGELLTGQHDPRMQLDLIHSPSWRVDGPSIILTWVGIARADNLVIEQWPNALPVTAKLFEKVGNPITHAANEPPTPRDIDVLMHAIRHLRFLRDTDESARAAMTKPWLQHLATWEPALSGLYSEPHKVA